MKGGNSWIYFGLGLIIGGICSYISVQYQFFEIDYKIPVLDTLIDVITILVGLYIAISINSQFSHKEHFINFIEPKLSEGCNKVSHLRELVDLDSQLDVTTVAKTFKDFEIINNHISKIFKIYNKDQTLMGLIENKLLVIDDIFFNQTSITNNIIDFSQVKGSILSNINDLDGLYLETIKYVHENQ